MSSGQATGAHAAGQIQAAAAPQVSCSYFKFKCTAAARQCPAQPLDLAGLFESQTHIGVFLKTARFRLRAKADAHENTWDWGVQPFGPLQVLPRHLRLKLSSSTSIPTLPFHPPKYMLGVGCIGKGCDQLVGPPPIGAAPPSELR